MATVRIENLRLRTIIGTYDWEREIKQDLILNISFDYDISEAAETDDFKYAVDYKDMKLRVIDLVESSSFYLIEKMAAEVLKLVLSTDRVTAGTVKVDKPGALRYCDTVSIEVSGQK